MRRAPASAAAAPGRRRRARGPVGPRGRPASTRPAAPGRRRAGSTSHGPAHGPGRPPGSGPDRAGHAASGPARRRWCATASPPAAASEQRARRRPGPRRSSWTPPRRTRPGRAQLDLQVHAVEQRPGELAEVPSPLLAAARARQPLAHRLPARARVGRQDQLEARRVPGGAGRAVQHQLAVLERLPRASGAPPSRTPGPRRGTGHRGAPGRLRPAAARPSRRRRCSPASRCGAGPRTAVGAAVRAPGSNAPATECTAVTSTASASDRSGSSPGSRAASMVLPVPGGPTMSRW